MAVTDHVDFPTFMEGVKRRNPRPARVRPGGPGSRRGHLRLHRRQGSIPPQQILRRIAEPDRVVSFRVCWEDDNGNIRVQRG